MNKLCLFLTATVLFGLGGTAGAAGNLTVYIWSEYMDPAIIRDFENLYDVKVRLDYYESNEEMVARFDKGGGLGLGV